MAARLNKRQATSVVAHIQSSLLVKALQDHVHDRREMTPTQVTAALGLLKKTTPDLKVMDLQGAVALNWELKVVRGA